jgi:hypothetical protein
MKKIIALLLACFFINAVFACTCLPIFDEKGNAKTFRQELDQFETIFLGKVTRIDSLYFVPNVFLEQSADGKDSVAGYFMQLKISMAVSKTYKGDANMKTIVIITGVGGGDCGYWFKEGLDYIVYARRQELNELIETTSGKSILKKSFLSTTSCDRTTDQIKPEEKLLHRLYGRKRKN